MLRTTVAALLIAALPAFPALAKEKGGKGNSGKGKGNVEKSSKANDAGRDRDQDRDRDDDWVRFSDADRGFWRTYWREQYALGNCPPGLAKKRNGCLPPGQAKKRYAIGRPLAPDVVVLAVPVPILDRLPPPGYGYRYGIVDGDLVKLAVGTLLVVDAIDGLLD